MTRCGTVNYHLPSPARQAYHIDAGGVVGRLLSPPHARTHVALTDVREAANAVSFSADSVSFEHAPTRVRAADFVGEDPSWQRDYERELRELLSRRLGAREVVVFDHTVRVDDEHALRKPARNVHSDYSPAGAEQRLVDLLGEARAAQWREGHYAFINVWRPIGAPINSAPLGFVRPSSVAPRDWLLLDLVYPDRLGQIMGLVANESHEWIYQSKMRPDEVACFNIYDNRGRASVAHSAVDLIEDPSIHRVRKSVESRTLVRY